MERGGITRRRFVKIGGALAATVAVGGTAAYAATWAPEEKLPRMRMGDGMSKVLVVYATKSGCTTGIAEHIGATLVDHGATVDVVPANQAGDPTDYDAVVVGSGIRMSQWHEPARTWVANNAEALKGMPVAFYTVNLTQVTEPDRAEEIRAWTDPLIEQTGVRPVDVATFTGWNEPKEFSFLERTIMKAMKAPQGDFRDLAAVEAWVRDTAAPLGLAS